MAVKGNTTDGMNAFDFIAILRLNHAYLVSYTSQMGWKMIRESPGSDPSKPEFIIPCLQRKTRKHMTCFPENSIDFSIDPGPVWILTILM